VMHGQWDAGWGVVMMLLALLFMALVVVGVVFLVRPSSSAEPPERRPDGGRALDVLDERFARGEIDRDEYEERRRVLTSGR
jgi:putative membrane protein